MRRLKVFAEMQNADITRKWAVFICILISGEPISKLTDLSTGSQSEVKSAKINLKGRKIINRIGKQRNPFVQHQIIFSDVHLMFASLLKVTRSF